MRKQRRHYTCRKEEALAGSDSLRHNLESQMLKKPLKSMQEKTSFT